MNKILLLTQGALGGEYIALSRLTVGWAKQSKGKVDLLAFIKDRQSNLIASREEYTSFHRVILIKQSDSRRRFSFIRNIITDYKRCSNSLKSLPLSEYSAIISSDYLMSLALVHFRLRARTPNIFAFHGLRSTPIKLLRHLNYRQLIIKIGELLAWITSSHILVPSAPAKEYIAARIKYLPIRKKIIIIPNLVSEVFSKKPDNKTIEKFTDKYNLCNRLVMVYIGRIIPRKGIERLVEIHSKIRLIYPNAILVLAYPSDRFDSRLLDWIKVEASSSNIVLLPDLTEIDIALLYHSASMLLLLSELEFAPLVLIEAITAGCPCIATDCGNSNAVLSPISSRLIVNTDQEIIDTIEWIQEMGIAEKEALKKRLALSAETHRPLEITNKFQNLLFKQSP